MLPGGAWLRACLPILLVVFTGSCVPRPGRSPRDALAPVIAGSTPEDNAAGVPVGTPLLVRFEPTTCADCVDRCDVDPTTLAGAVSLSPEVAGLRVAFDGLGCRARLTTPTGLRESTTYVLTVAPTIEDIFGNAPAPGSRPYVVHFTTADTGADASPPRFMGSWPPDGDARLLRTAPVLLLFDEPVRTPLSVTGAQGIRQVSRAESFGIELQPVGSWPSGALSLTISGVTDRSGNTAPDAIALSLVVPASEDVTAPQFAGVDSLTASGSVVEVSWAHATDDVSASSSIRYLVWAGEDASALSFEPLVVTPPGATSAVLLAPESGRLTVRVRAQDEAGNVDANAVDRTLEGG